MPPLVLLVLAFDTATIISLEAFAIFYTTVYSILPSIAGGLSLSISGKTIFPRWMTFTNVLIIFGVLKSVSLLIPVSAFRLGFTNGLMSESMIVWFGFMLWKGASGYERIAG